jgi:hypothetical protein
VAHPWPVFPPEVNYTSMTSGAGPMLAYGDVLLAHGASMMAVAGVPSAVAGLLGGAPLAAPSSSVSSGQPMAAVEHAAVVPSQALAPAHSPSMGMFAPPLAAASVGASPGVPSPAADAPVAQMMTPRPNRWLTCPPTRHDPSHPCLPHYKTPATSPTPSTHHPNNPHHSLLHRQPRSQWRRRATHMDRPPVPVVLRVPVVPAPRHFVPDSAERRRRRPCRCR